MIGLTGFRTFQLSSGPAVKQLGKVSMKPVVTDATTAISLFCVFFIVLTFRTRPAKRSNPFTLYTPHSKRAVHTHSFKCSPLAGRWLILLVSGSLESELLILRFFARSKWFSAALTDEAGQAAKGGLIALLFESLFQLSPTGSGINRDAVGRVPFSAGNSRWFRR
jgi:hypothetical protein